MVARRPLSSPRRRPTASGPTSSILDAITASELLRLTDDDHSFSPVWSPAGDAIAFLQLDGDDRRPARSSSTGAPGAGRSATRRPDRGVRARRRRRGRAGSSRRRSCRRRRVAPSPPPDRPRPPRPPRDPGGRRDRERRPPRRRTSSRLAARSAATGTVLCLGIDPDPAALPPGFSRDLRGVERFARLLLDAAAPYAAAVKPNLAFFEAFGSAGLAALERLRAAVPADSRRRSTRSAATSGRRRRARRSRLRRPRRRRDHRQPVPRRGGHRAAPRTHRPPRLRPVPDLEPRRGRAPGRWSSQPTAATSARRSRSTSASPGGPRRGARAARSGSSSARPRRPSSPRSGRSRPGCRSSSRASAPRAARSVPCSPTARRRDAPGRPSTGGGLLVNVTRGIAGRGGRPDHGTRRSRRRSGRPPPSGPPASLCYPSRRARPVRRRPP